MPIRNSLTRFAGLILALLTILTVAGCSTSGPTEEAFEPPVYPPAPEKPRFIYERSLRTSFDVKEVTAMEKFKSFATGIGGSGFGLAKPYDVAVYQGRVFVSDTVQRVVLEFDAPGRDFKIIGQEGKGELTKPIGLAVDRNDGTLYVVDHTTRRVVVFDKDGKYLRAIGGKGYFQRPSGVTISPDGKKLYVVDTGGVDSTDHHLLIFNALTGAHLKTVGSRGTEAGQFNLPLMAATAPDGTVYVVDGGNFRVEAFTADGKFKMEFGAIGRRSGQFSRPKGIACDNDGNIYVVDAAFGNFQIFNPKGQLLLFVGDRGYDGKPGEYMLPAGVAVDEDGRVYMVDQYFKKVDVFRPFALPENQGWLSSKRKDKTAEK